MAVDYPHIVVGTSLLSLASIILVVRRGSRGEDQIGCVKKIAYARRPVGNVGEDLGDE